MGCQMLALIDAASTQAACAIQEAPDWFAGRVHCFSHFRIDSGLDQCKRRAGQRQLVCAEMWQVFQIVVSHMLPCADRYATSAR
jgi:hypothetical protein